MPKDIAPPARGFSFKDFSLSKPGQALPGDRLDTELDRLAGKFGDLEAFLLTSFERDGSLKGSAVSQRHLKPDILAPVMLQIDGMVQKAQQSLDQREKSTQNLATEALTARTQAKTAAQEAQNAVQEAKALNQQAQQAAQQANQARARSEASLIPLANLQSDAQTAANSARIAEDMAYRWAEKTDGPVFVPNGGDPVDDGFYSSKFWAVFTKTSVENGSFWYLGARAAPPTTGNGGAALQPGMWYFDTGNAQTFLWNGTIWEPITGAVGTVASVFGRQGAVQAQANDYAAFYLRLSGGTLTGALTLSASPTALLHAATKGYVDQQDTALNTSLRAYVDQQDAAFDQAVRAYTDTQVATRLPLAGGQMNGQIKSVGFPVAAEDLGSKGYIDTKVATEIATRLPLSGGTLTGPLTLPQAPTADLHASTKKYVDDMVSGITFPPGTSVGPTAPANPAQGQLWYRTAEPVGLFVWFNDGDSSQWVQTAGGGPFESPPGETAVEDTVTVVIPAAAIAIGQTPTFVATSKSGILMSSVSLQLATAGASAADLEVYFDLFKNGVEVPGNRGSSRQTLPAAVAGLGTGANLHINRRLVGLEIGQTYQFRFFAFKQQNVGTFSKVRLRADFINV